MCGGGAGEGWRVQAINTAATPQSWPWDLERRQTQDCPAFQVLNKSITYPDFKWWQLIHIKKKNATGKKKQKNTLLPGWWDTSLQPLSQCL